MKSSWTVPAGTMAAGLEAAGVAGVEGLLWLRVVLTVPVVFRGAAVVTTGAAVVPAGAAAFCRLSWTPPWTFCWSAVWKVPLFWLKAMELVKEFGLAAGTGLCSNLMAGRLRVKPSNSASKSNDPL